MAFISLRLAFTGCDDKLENTDFDQKLVLATTKIFFVAFIIVKLMSDHYLFWCYSLDFAPFGYYRAVSEFLPKFCKSLSRSDLANIVLTPALLG